jgi:hypothetical protein
MKAGSRLVYVCEAFAMVLAALIGLYPSLIAVAASLSLPALATFCEAEVA